MAAPFGLPLGLPEQPGLKRPLFGARPQSSLAQARWPAGNGRRHDVM